MKCQYAGDSVEPQSASNVVSCGLQETEADKKAREAHAEPTTQQHAGLSKKLAFHRDHCRRRKLNTGINEGQGRIIPALSGECTGTHAVEVGPSSMKTFNEVSRPRVRRNPVLVHRDRDQSRRATPSCVVLATAKTVGRFQPNNIRTSSPTTMSCSRSLLPTRSSDEEEEPERRREWRRHEVTAMSQARMFPHFGGAVETRTLWMLVFSICRWSRYLSSFVEDTGHSAAL